MIVIGTRNAVRLLTLLLAFLASSCVSTQHRSRDWSSFEGPGAHYFQAEEIVFPYKEDPLEPVNRFSAGANYFALRYGVAPLSKVYRAVIPGVVRNRVAKAGRNLLFPGRLINNLLQGKLAESGIEASRFAINSTVGLLGLFDPAQKWGLHPFPEDFGQTFASWGWKDSTYLFLPFLGPSTLRDGLGEIPDALADPLTYYFPAVYARGFNSLSGHVDADLRTIEGAYDAYEPGRTLFALQREVDVEDFEWEQRENGATQTLRAIFLAPEDERFAGRGKTRKALIDGHREGLPYSLWLQPEPGPLMYVIPGLGGHRLGASALALAELAYAEGHSVVTVSNPTNWEFMRFGASVTVPGFGPMDAGDLHRAMEVIDRNLAARYPARFEQRRILGLSMGAYQALWIAGGGTLEDPTTAPRLEFELCVALNPPVEIEHALLELDRFYNRPLEFPQEQRPARIEQIFGKVLYLSHGDLEPSRELPFDELEAQFLIGLAFRFNLQSMILQSQELEDLGVLQTDRSRWHMAPAFREAAEYSYMEYFYAFALPYFAGRGIGIEHTEAGAQAMFERSRLQRVAAGLQAHEGVRVFTNRNDFLMRAEDIEWLEGLLGERLTVFEDGGHLGNLYKTYIRAVIGEVLNEGQGPVSTP